MRRNESYPTFFASFKSPLDRKTSTKLAAIPALRSETESSNCNAKRKCLIDSFTLPCLKCKVPVHGMCSRLVNNNSIPSPMSWAQLTLRELILKASSKYRRPNSYCDFSTNSIALSNFLFNKDTQCNNSFEKPI